MLGLAANLQSGKDLGVLSDGDSGNRKQANVLPQATWQATAKAKLGLNWGESRLKDGVASDLHGGRQRQAQPPKPEWRQRFETTNHAALRRSARH